MARVSPLELAETRLAQRLKYEDACKMATSACVGAGTHKQAVTVAHRATQRSVEYYQARITMLQNGGYAGLTSSDRAEIRVAACMLADADDSPGGSPPARAFDVLAEYTRSADRKALLRAWQASDWAALGCLWLAGCKGGDVAESILRIFA